MADDILSYPLEKRMRMSEKIMEIHPNTKPFVYLSTDRKLPPTKVRIAMQEDRKIADIMKTMHDKVNVDHRETLFLMVKVSFYYRSVNMNSTVLEVYEKYKNPDGFLYFTVTKENCFGKKS